MTKKRILRIGIASHAEIQRRTLDIARGKLKPLRTDPKIWLTSHKAYYQVFSDVNMMLIEMIRDHAPESVTELAELAKRQRPNVTRALNLLEQYTVIELVDGPKGKKKPQLNYDEYVLTGTLAKAA